MKEARRAGDVIEFRNSRQLAFQLSMSVRELFAERNPEFEIRMKKSRVSGSRYILFRPLGMEGVVRFRRMRVSDHPPRSQKGDWDDTVHAESFRKGSRRAVMVDEYTRAVHSAVARMEGMAGRMERAE